MEPSLSSILASKTRRVRKRAAKFRLADHAGVHGVAAAKCVVPHQQRYAALRSTVPSRNSVKEAAIQ